MPWTTLTATNPTGSVTAPPFNLGNSVVPAASGVVQQTGRGAHVEQRGNDLSVRRLHGHRDVHGVDALTRRTGAV